MAARRPGGFSGRTGVIIDRARPLIPPSAVPEELIAQAQVFSKSSPTFLFYYGRILQVVLQGKSREVIVKELQRTNLNVNEAVNNLLSRDDDEGSQWQFEKYSGACRFALTSSSRVPPLSSRQLLYKIWRQVTQIFKLIVSALSINNSWTMDAYMFWFSSALYQFTCVPFLVAHLLCWMSPPCEMRKNCDFSFFPR